MTRDAEYSRPEQSNTTSIYPKASQLLEEPSNKRPADAAAPDQAPRKSFKTNTPSSGNKPYNPRKHILNKMTKNPPPTSEANGTDGNEPKAICLEGRSAPLRTSASLGPSTEDDIKDANMMIIIAPPSVKYVNRRPTILGRPATNFTVIRDTLEDFCSHQAKTITKMQVLLDAYESRKLSEYRLCKQGLEIRLKAYKVIKTKAEEMLKCLPAEDPSSPFKHMSLSLDSRRTVTPCTEEGLKLISCPTVHIFLKEIHDAASNIALPNANKAANDQTSAFSSGNRQHQEEAQSTPGLLELFRALIRKANHSRRGISSTTSDESPFRLRDLSLEKQHPGHQDAVLEALKALKHLNVNAAEAYIVLCAALQESLSPLEP